MHGAAALRERREEEFKTEESATTHTNGGRAKAPLARRNTTERTANISEHNTRSSKLSILGRALRDPA